MKKSNWYVKNLGIIIIVATLLGIATGAIMKENASVLKPLGDLFIQLIKMVVIPLVTASIISGAASLKNGKSAGKIGLSTIAFYLGSTMVAVILGLIAGEIFKPGSGVALNSLQSMFSDEFADKGGLPTFWETIIGFVPENPIKALVDGNILQILFFSLFLGFGIASLKEEKRVPLLNFFDSISDALVFVILKVMYIAPIGVFALMADAVGTFGFEVLKRIMSLFIVYVGVLLIHTFGVYSLALKLFSKMPLRKFFNKISKVQLFALSTSSSMATLSFNMETCEEELGLSKETTSFVLPLGATINMDGNAVYYALAACFFAQLFGIDLGMQEYIAIIITATVGSIGQAGVPGPSLLVVAVLLAANIPVAGLPILFGVDRLFDMLRTATNVTGDATCAVIVNKFSTTNETT